MVNDIQAMISSKLTDIDRQVGDLQQACVLFGIKDGKIAHRLQHIRESVEDAHHISAGQ